MNSPTAAGCQANRQKISCVANSIKNAVHMMNYKIGLTLALMLATSIVSAAPAKMTSRTAKTTSATKSWLDPASSTQEQHSDLSWYNASNLLIEGRGWNDAGTSSIFVRLPARADAFVTPAVWELSHNTAGMAVRFVTDATSISAIWSGSGIGMNHMARTGSSGIDLYVKRDGEWKYAGTGRPHEDTTLTLTGLASNLDEKPSEYLLYLPLYHDVSELKLGIARQAHIGPALPHDPARKPIVFYGTSITQGGCASRAGMCHVALLGRWLDREVINLGFSGSGKMEPELATLFTELDPAIYVLECLPNMTDEMVSKRVEPFVKILRSKHAETPIVLVANPLKPATDQQNINLRNAFRKLQSEGIKHLSYIEGMPQLAGRENATVDGVHPTDLGFFRMAEYYYPRLKKLLR
jgi:hypothetical protein